jgi:hypothetical protein
VCGRRMEEVALWQEVKDNLCTQCVLKTLWARTEAEMAPGIGQCLLELQFDWGRISCALVS